ncbi:MAG: nuclear transport factor 2 family protein [Halieaceae bacterium]
MTAANSTTLAIDTDLWSVWSDVQIRNRLAQHARGIDRADEALLREAYHADGTVDYGSLQGTAAEFAQAIAVMHDGAPMSSHRTSNIWVKIEGESAISESYVMAWVTLPTDGDPQPHLVGGRYLDRHSFKNDEWRMQHRHYVLDWIRQFPPTATPADAAAFNLAGSCPSGAHFPQDPGNALLLAYARADQSSTEVPTMTEHDALDQALSHQAILELGCRYVRGVDRGDPATIMTAFHEDAAIVSGAFNGSAVDFSTEIGKLLDEISPRVAHTVTNHWIDIQGDNAVGESYVIAYQNTLGDEPQDVMTGGRYIDRYERRDGVWKISHRTFVLDWTTSTASKDLMGLGMFEDMVKGERGTGDPVFALWDSLA